MRNFSEFSRRFWKFKILIIFSACDFKCNDGTCQSNDKRCDGKNDCSDGIDETNCGVCTRTQFQCETSSTCIEYLKRCDEINDCSDGSDEANCTGKYKLLIL